MLLGNIFQQLYNMVDSIVVGNVIGDQALAAVGTGFPIIYMLSSLFMGIGTGATVMISQYYGARDLEKVDHTINTIYMALLVGVVPLTLIGVFLSEPLLRLMAGAGRRHAGDGKDLHDYYLHRRHRQPGL